jgi:hypothetical protein
MVHCAVILVILIITCGFTGLDFGRPLLGDVRRGDCASCVSNTSVVLVLRHLSDFNALGGVPTSGQPCGFPDR